MKPVGPARKAKRQQFLDALARLGNVTAAAEEAGLDRVALYRLRWRNPKFAQSWDEAAEIGAGGLADEAVRRAAEGVVEPLYHRGEQVGSVRKYSDGLLTFLLKARLPETYGDRRGEGKEKPDEEDDALSRLLAKIDGKTLGLPSRDQT